MTGPLDELLTGHGVDAVVPEPSPPFRFSVIVRTQGNRPGSLCEAVESVAAQSHRDHELLVMVHADDDRTAAVEASLPPAGDADRRILAVSGGGRARPLNAGLDAATGDYVCILDDDDLVTPHWLAAFARAAADDPGRVVRAVTRSQAWTTDGGEEPVRPIGPVETPFAPTFDLLAHMSANQTPVCSLALPRAALDRFGLRFDESLPVFEDWELLMRLAMLVGVTSIDDATSLYRRLDHGNADTVVEEPMWHEAHARVIDRLSAQPVLLPSGDARRIASAHFVPGGGSRHDAERATAEADLAALTRSPARWLRAFASRAGAAARHRFAARRP